jgi:hypothetical protein
LESAREIAAWAKLNWYWPCMSCDVDAP